MIARNTANNTDTDEKPVQILGVKLEQNGEGTVNTGGERDTVVTEIVKAQGNRISFQTDYTLVSPSKSREFFGIN